MFRFWKTAKACANLFMLYMSWRWWKHGLNAEFAVSCLILSSMWLALSVGQLGFLLRSYTTNISRLQFHLPLWFGVVLAGCAFYDAPQDGKELLLRVASVLVLAGWAGVYIRFRYNKKLFAAQGHGVLPAGIMVNPPAEALPAGSILLMSGIAGIIGESVGHGEIVVVDDDGKKWAFSTYMKFGTVLNPLDEVLPRRAKHGITVARVPVEPWTEEQRKLSMMQAHSMLRQNKEWTIRRRLSREKTLSRLPLPAVLKVWFNRKFAVTGYDWFGLFLGRVKPNHWTCIGSVQELLWRTGITLDQYFGTGLIGAGTSILDPIMPARFFDLKCYRNLSIQDCEQYKADKR